MWHGRNSYKRSAKLAQFVIHRGLIIAVIQAVFSSIFFFARESWLLFSSRTNTDCSHCSVSRMAPSGIRHVVHNGSGLLSCSRPRRQRRRRSSLPRTVQGAHQGLYFSEALTLLIAQGRSLSYKTFFIWLLISVYQGKLFLHHVADCLAAPL